MVKIKLKKRHSYLFDGNDVFEICFRSWGTKM